MAHHANPASRISLGGLAESPQLISLARAVHDLVRNFGEDRFRDMLRDYLEAWKSRRQAEKAFNEERKEYFANNVLRQCELRNEEEPPAADMEWEREPINIFVRLPAELRADPSRLPEGRGWRRRWEREVHRYVSEIALLNPKLWKLAKASELPKGEGWIDYRWNDGGWIPAHLTRRYRPRNPSLLPLVPGGTRSLPEKYAALTAIHAIACGCERLKNLFPETFPEMEGDHVSPQLIESMVFHGLRDQASRLRATDIKRLQDDLENVRADLQAHVEIHKPGRPHTEDIAEQGTAVTREIDDDIMLSSQHLAKHFELPSESVRKRLQRFRKKNDDGWRETTNRKPNQPRYLYRMNAVRHLFDEPASGQTSSQRPAK